MCTVSWIHEDRGYQLFCNRDEKLTRRPAIEPQQFFRDDVRVLAPIDGDSGGTWIATNEFGLTVCLLNGISGGGSGAAPRRSRGLIVLDLASAASSREVMARVWQSGLQSYEPFTLAVLELGQRATVIEWDGAKKRILPFADSHMPLVSSSVEPDAVRNQRRFEFARVVRGGQVLDPVSLLMFHQSHLPECGPHSVCMHRADAETVSFSWVTVTDTEASFYYSAGPPCRTLSGASYTLAIGQEDSAPCLVSC